MQFHIAPQQHKFHLHVYVISFTDKTCLAALQAGFTLAILKKSLFWQSQNRFDNEVVIVHAHIHFHCQKKIMRAKVESLE